MHYETITVFGGSGFLGRYIVRRLAQSGARIRVAVRDPEAANLLQPMGDVGQIRAVPANLRHAESIRQAVEGADVVINCVGLLSESGAQTFGAVQANGAGRVAEAAAAAGAKRLIHLSAIGSDPASPAKYGRSKAAGEALVREHFPDATIIRPSVVFGPEDGFFNLFGRLAQVAPMLPLIGGGATRMQPVYVGDVAEGVEACMAREGTRGQTFELGGPEVVSMKECMQRVLEHTGRRCLLMPVPWALAEIQGVLLGLLPNPLLTLDQVRLLRVDNVVSEGARTLGDLGVGRTAMQAVLPRYMTRYARFGRLETGRFG